MSFMFTNAMVSCDLPIVFCFICLNYMINKYASCFFFFFFFAFSFIIVRKKFN